MTLLTGTRKVPESRRKQPERPALFANQTPFKECFCLQVYMTVMLMQKLSFVCANRKRLGGRQSKRHPNVCINQSSQVEIKTEPTPPQSLFPYSAAPPAEHPAALTA